MKNASGVSRQEDSRIVRVLRNLAVNHEGSQLVELAFVLPLLAVMIVGIFILARLIT